MSTEIKLVINDKICITLFEDADGEKAVGIEYQEDSNKLKKSLGLKFETLNKIHSIINSNMSAIETLFGASKSKGE